MLWTAFCFGEHKRPRAAHSASGAVLILPCAEPLSKALPGRSITSAQPPLSSMHPAQQPLLQLMLSHVAASAYTTLLIILDVW